jgi:hypothetical protein
MDCDYDIVGMDCDYDIQTGWIVTTTYRRDGL